MMKRRKLFFLPVAVLFYAIASNSVFSQNLPERPVPPHLVNDFSGMLSGTEAGMLERKLVSFNDSTSTQITIVTVKNLDGYDKADYAQRLGEKWGIGQKSRNNGLLILIKPKTSESDGEVFIAQGYGLEGVIPDLTCQDIINKEILPAFRNKEYYNGLDNATNVLMSLARGEFSASQYGQKAKTGKQGGIPIGFIIFLIFIIITLVSRKSGGSNNRHIGSGALPLWLLLGGLNSGRGSSGSWGGFSGGGSSGGGFGGFGGGSFGGGGAGGSW
jgi:uncharacterized protein